MIDLNLEEVENILDMLRMRISSLKDYMRIAEQHPEIEAFQNTAYTTHKLKEHEALEKKMTILFHKLCP
jgi:hypothetical protein